MPPSPGHHRRPWFGEQYLLHSQQPLHALIFLLPLIALYEIGTMIYATDPAGRQISILARSFLEDFLELFGAVGGYMPGLLVVGVLVSWHFARGDRWSFRPKLYVVMAGESLVLALPLLMFVFVALGRPTGTLHRWQAEIVFSIGAGVYEEMVFRLMAIALLHIVFCDLLALADRTGAALSILCSTILFVAYHFTDAPFNASQCIFYAVAGLYFAVIYVERGFGIVAATHAVYDILIVLITHRIVTLG